MEISIINRFSTLAGLALSLVFLSGCSVLIPNTGNPNKPRIPAPDETSAVPIVISKPTIAMVGNSAEGKTRNLTFRVSLGSDKFKLAETDPIRWRIDGGEIKSCRLNKGLVEVVVETKGAGKLEFDGFSFAAGPKNDIKPDFSPVTWSASGQTAGGNRPKPSGSTGSGKSGGTKPSGSSSGSRPKPKPRTGGGSQHSGIDWGD